MKLKVPKLRMPRKGWSFAVGRVLFDLNISRSWDGWGETSNNGKTVTYKFLTVEPFIATFGLGVHLCFWRFRLSLGYAKPIPKDT